MKIIRTIINSNIHVLQYVLCFFLLLGITSVLLPAIDGPSLELFLESDMRGVIDSNDDSVKNESVLRDRLTAINLPLLCELGEEGSRDSKAGQRIFLDLFTDAYLVARIQKIEKTISGGIVLSGDLDGIPNSEVILAFKGNVLSGNISMPEHFYQVRFVQEGVHRIMEIDNSKFPPEHTPIPGTPGPVTQADSPLADSGIYYDVMVVYDEAARTQAGGTTAMETLIDLMITETNIGYSNSDVTQRVRLVHTAEVSYSEDGMNWDTTLYRLQLPSDGYMDEVHTLRDTYGADNVVFIVKSMTVCGIAFVMSPVSSSFATEAFCVVSLGCATGYYSFAHEMGHNMGAKHDRANAEGLGAYSYSYGYQAPDKAFRTIMAYPCGTVSCPRRNYWSNPDVYYGGQPMGVIYTDPNSADNHLTLNNTLSTFQNFRQSISMTLTAPNEGESWPIGSLQLITWTYTGNIANVKIQYSTDNGRIWEDIIASTPNTGSYAWTIPNELSTECLVRVFNAANEAVYDVSNSTFSISSIPTITLTSPNGNENWLEGSTHDITWTNTGTITNVKLQYSTNNGGAWADIIASAPNTGSYAWVIPYAPSTQCLVKVLYGANEAIYDVSNTTFTLSSVPASLSVTSPNGFENWLVGSTHNITWTNIGTITNVKIEYTTNGGGVWNVLSTSTGNTGTYPWVIPNAPSNSYKVRISDAAVGTITDASNMCFSIVTSFPAYQKFLSMNGDNLTDIIWRYDGTGGANRAWITGGIAADTNFQSKDININTNNKTNETRTFIDAIRNITPDMDADQNGYVAGQPGIEKLMNDNSPTPEIYMNSTVETGKTADALMNTFNTNTPDEAQAISMTETKTIQAVTDLNWKIEGTGDFNTDGKMDLLWRHYSTGKNLVWIMNGNQLLRNEVLPYTKNLNWKMIGGGDFNNDGKADILWRNYENGKNIIWIMDGLTFNYGVYIPTVADLDWEMVGIGDMDGNGKMDILWRHKTTGANKVWIMNGTSFLSEISLPAISDLSWKCTGCGEFNNDGKTDIIWRRSNGNNLIWIMNGLSISGFESLPAEVDEKWKIEN